jgi:hypothetical protein
LFEHTTQSTHVTACCKLDRTLSSRVKCLAKLAQQLPISAAPELWEGEMREGERGSPRSRSFEHEKHGTHVAYWIVSRTLFSRVKCFALPRPPLVRAYNAKHACCVLNRFTNPSHEWRASHSWFSRSQSVRLNCANENVSRRGPARSSLRRKARTLHIDLDRFTHPLPTSGLSITARCCNASFPSRPRHSLILNAKARRYLASREKARPNCARQQINRCCPLGRIH